MRSQVQVLAGPPPIVAGQSAASTEPGALAARLGPRWGRTPIPAGTSNGPAGAAHPAVRLGDDHTAWSSTQPEDASTRPVPPPRAAACPSCPPRGRPRRAPRTPAGPGWSLSGQARPPRPAPDPAARVASQLPLTQRDFGSVARVPASATVDRAVDGPAATGVSTPSRWSGSPGHLDLVPTATA